MKREDVLNVEGLKEQLSESVGQMNRSLRTVFGEVIYAIDTVIEKYNTLETRFNDLQHRFDDLQQRHDRLEANFATVTERLLRLEHIHGDSH